MAFGALKTRTNCAELKDLHRNDINSLLNLGAAQLLTIKKWSRVVSRLCWLSPCLPVSSCSCLPVSCSCLALSCSCPLLGADPWWTNAKHSDTQVTKSTIKFGQSCKIGPENLTIRPGQASNVAASSIILFPLSCHHHAVKQLCL